MSQQLEELEKMIKQLTVQQNRRKYLKQMNFSYNIYSITQIDQLLAICSTIVKQDEFALDIILKIAEFINIQHNGKQISSIINRYHYKTKFINKLFQILKNSTSQEQLDNIISENISSNSKYLAYIYLDQTKNASDQFFNTLFINKFSSKIDAFLDMLIKTFSLLQLSTDFPSNTLTYLYRNFIKKYIILNSQQNLKTVRLAYQLLYIILLYKKNILEYEDQIFLKQFLNQNIQQYQIYQYAWMCLMVTYIQQKYDNNHIFVTLNIDSWEDENDILLMLNNGVINILSVITQKHYYVNKTEYYEILQHYKQLLQIPFDIDVKFIVDQLISSSACLQLQTDKQLLQIHQLLAILHKSSPIYIDLKDVQQQIQYYDIYHLYFILYIAYVLNNSCLDDQSLILRAIDKFQGDKFMFVKTISLLSPDTSFSQYLEKLHILNQDLFYYTVIGLNDQQANSVYNILFNDLQNYLQNIQIDKNLQYILQIWDNHCSILQNIDVEVILQSIEMFLMQLVRQLNILVINKESQMVLLIFLRFLEKISECKVDFNYYLILVNLTDLYVLQFKETRYIISKILLNVLDNQKENQCEQHLEYKLAQRFLQMLESGIQAIRQVSSQGLSTLLKYKMNQVIIPVLYEFKYQHNKHVKLGIIKAFSDARINNELAIRLINFAIQQNDISFREQGIKFIIQQNLQQMTLQQYFHYLNLIQVTLSDPYFNDLTLEYFGIAGNYELHSYKSLMLINYLQLGLLTPKTTIQSHYKRCFGVLQQQHDFLLSKYGINYQQLMLEKHVKMKQLRRSDKRMELVQDFQHHYQLDFNMSEFEL